VGGCYSSLGKFEEARAWFERAVAAKEKGDVHGRVIPQASEQAFIKWDTAIRAWAKFEDARAWFEARRHRSMRGATCTGAWNPESLGASLIRWAIAYLSVGKFEEARVWVRGAPPPQWRRAMCTDV